MNVNQALLPEREVNGIAANLPMDELTGITTDAVVLKGLTKRFTDAKGEHFAAVDGLDLRIGRGEVVAFLGPNGAGKTTTIDMLLGLTQPDAGTVELFGRAPVQATRAGQVSAVMQTGGLLPELTVGATVRMLGSLYPGSDPDRCLERAGIARLKDRRVASCSGGEQQRLRFALALLPSPEFIVLDEPTAGMDVQARHDFWAAVRQDAARGMTVMFATHYLEEADQFADRIVLLDRGRVVADGSAASIRAAATGRTVSAVLPAGDAERIAARTGARLLELRGDRAYFATQDSDALVKLLVTKTAATELEVVPRSLEDAFLALTQHHRTDPEDA
jgi:ABC-2 type transport system ATP-binding protein